MKSFLQRGLEACGFGPLTLAVVYLILQKQCGIHTVSVNEMCMGIISISLLAFIAGGINSIYKIERLPLMTAILIHGSVLYVAYLATYLINGWLDRALTPILIFTTIFAISYLAIWATIYAVTKNNTSKINEALKQKQTIYNNKK